MKKSIFLLFLVCSYLLNAQTSKVTFSDVAAKAGINFRYGKREIIKNVAADRYVTIAEGKGIVE